MVVTDQRMPKMTGVELLREVRQRQPDAVGIILTAFTDVDVLIEGRQPRAGLPVHHEAVGPQGGARHAPVRDRAVRSDAREQAARGAARGVHGLPEPAAPRRVRLRQHHRRLARRCARCSAKVEQVAPTNVDRAAPRRDRHRQGDGRARDPHQLAARAQAVRARELRRARAPASSRASSSVTRRAASPAPWRVAPAASSWPTAAPSSSTRSATSRWRCRSSCSARSRSASSSASAASETIKVDVRLARQRDQPQPREDDRGGRVPRGSLLPVERLPDQPAAAARPPRGSSRCWHGALRPRSSRGTMGHAPRRVRRPRRWAKLREYNVAGQRARAREHHRARHDPGARQASSAVARTSTSGAARSSRRRGFR